MSFLLQGVLSVGLLVGSAFIGSSTTESPAEEPIESDPNAGLVRLSLVLGIVISAFTVYQFVTTKG